LVSNPRVVLTNKNLNDILAKIQALLDDFVDIIVYDFPNALPPIRSIIYHIDLILGTILPNKVACKMTAKENEEIKNQVQELLLDNWLSMMSTLRVFKIPHSCGRYSW